MIEPMPFNFHILCLAPESFLMITLALIFLGVNRDWNKILITSLFQSALLFILINYFNSEITIVYNYITLIIFTAFFMNVNMKKSIISISVAMAIGILIKGTSTLILLSLTNMTVIDVVISNWVRFIFLVPYFLQLGLVIVLVRRYKFTLEPKFNN